MERSVIRDQRSLWQHPGWRFAPSGLRALFNSASEWPSPPIRPPPTLIADPRRFQRRAVGIDAIVFRAITIAWNHIVIPRRWPDHRRRDDKPLLRLTNDVSFPRPGFSTRRPEIAQHHGSSERARDSHDFHALASLRTECKRTQSKASEIRSRLMADSWREARRVGKGALAPCPPSLNNCATHGGHASLCPPYAATHPTSSSRHSLSQGRVFAQAGRRFEAG
jgi:hypothetical protein